MAPTQPPAGNTPLAVGQPAPDFKLRTDEGQLVSLTDFRGKKVVLFFYPEDDTPTCTKEACAFRDGIGDLRQHGAVVFGVSPDPVDSHVKFKRKYRLNFPLLSDVDKQAINAYDVWHEKTLFGRKYMGVVRTTFVIDEQGKIAKIFSNVRIKGHVDDVLAAL